MEYRTLELNVISAKDLKDVNLFTKMEVYATVSIAGHPETKQKTPVDRDGGKNPNWNFPVKFTIDESAAQQNRVTIVFQIRCQRSLGDKDIGVVHVPIKELLDTGAEKPLQFLSYQVRKPSGKPKGVLNFSYKFGEKFNASSTTMPAQVKADEPVTAYPVQAVGSSSAYPPQPGMAYPPQPGMAYPPVQPYYPDKGYPPPQPVTGYGYQAQAPHPHGGYPPAPQQASYGYPPPQQGYGYGHPPVQQPQAAKKKNKFGMGMGAGLLGGALGGLLIGDMVSDAGGFDGGFDGGFGDMGDF